MMIQEPHCHHLSGHLENKRGSVLIQGGKMRLQKSILYGPVNSRRLGRSLGINLMPQKYKLCSFNCVYCQYGWTRQWTLEVEKFKDDLPSVQEVLSEIESVLRSDITYDYLTFSGNGEPTIYPGFAEVVERVNTLRNEIRPDTHIALLSNSSGLIYEDVVNALDKIDFPVMKLDAGTKPTFNAISLPAPGIDFDVIIEKLRSLDHFLIQTAFIEGNPSNTSPQELDAYFRIIKDIQPAAVHIYTIERDVPHSGIFMVDNKDLERIAADGEARTGIPFKAFESRK
jgi:wyosine [tRNA(Phe)-imidazoG37] synthetase (radical SAM superfamily)